MFTELQIVHGTESSLLVSSGRFRMQTELAYTVNLSTSKKQSVQLLLDCGSQRTYISKNLVNKLRLVPDDTEILTAFTFGIRNLRLQWLSLV